MHNEELIKEARELKRGGAFKRKVLRRDPVDLYLDQVLLERSLCLVLGDDYKNCRECLAGWWREQEGQ
jgi:hypothetical protein